jgi:uncharacterized protein YjbI with pentapeptide repeats
MSLSHISRRRPRLATGARPRAVRRQGLRVPTATSGTEQLKPSRVRRSFTTVGGWNWTAIASIIAALAAAGGVFYTGRSLDATSAENKTAEQGQFTERFTKAVDQLDRTGPDHLQARLGGIYAMERLARDSPLDHPTIVEVLTAFIRTTAEPRIAINSCSNSITPDTQAALTVLGRRNLDYDNGNKTIDLRGLCLRGADLSYTHLGHADLEATDLTAAHLDKADLSHVVLTSANLTHADAIYTQFGYSLDHAVFTSAVMTFARLQEANCTGCNFTDTFLVDADLERSALDHANFSGADVREADFTEARLFMANFSDTTHSPDTTLTDAKFIDSTIGGWWQ